MYTFCMSGYICWCGSNEQCVPVQKLLLLLRPLTIHCYS